MLFIVAWRNIWRSRTRSLVVIGAIIIGIWSLVFMLSFSSGMVKSYVDNAIENEVSHIQIHHPEFMEDREIKYAIQEGETGWEQIKAKGAVQASTIRTLAGGMLSSGKGARGIQVRGIEPEAEKAVTKIHEKIGEGTYFDANRKNQIIISKRLADKLKVKLRSKVVLTFQDMEGEIVAAAFRIVGLFSTKSAPFDEMNVFVLRKDLNRLIEQPNVSHEIAIILKDPKTLEPLQQELSAVFPALKVETYREISPDVQLYESQIQTSATIFIVIIMLALIFGIINTMLMTVLERIRELGMLMAIGMNKGKVFFMIVLETVLLAVVAAFPGLLMGYLTVNYFGNTGINLSAFSKGMQQFGISEIVYPFLETQYYRQMVLAVCITAILGAIYPAFKAIRLRPVEAIRKI